MVAIVLIGVMVDRPTLTFRTLTVAAFGVLLLAPEAIVHLSSSLDNYQGRQGRMMGQISD